MSEAEEVNAAAGGTPPSPASAPRRIRRRPVPGVTSGKSRTGLRWRLGFVLVVLALLVGGYGMIGRALPLPVWMVAEVATRLNRALSPSLPEAVLALGGVHLTLD